MQVLLKEKTKHARKVSAKHNFPPSLTRIHGLFYFVLSKAKRRDNSMKERTAPFTANMWVIFSSSFQVNPLAIQGVCLIRLAWLWFSLLPSANVISIITICISVIMSKLPWVSIISFFFQLLAILAVLAACAIIYSSVKRRYGTMRSLLLLLLLLPLPLTFCRRLIAIIISIFMNFK